MKNEHISYWSQSAEVIKVAPLDKSIQTEILVIGAGMAGILNAYELNKRGHKVTVVDAHELAQLTSAHTTAKLTLQHFTPYQMLLKNIGKAGAKLYHESQLDGIENYRQLIEICIEEGVTFYQSTPVKYIEGDIAYTDQHEITFDHVVMASREVVLFCTYCDSLLK